VGGGLGRPRAQCPRVDQRVRPVAWLRHGELDFGKQAPHLVFQGQVPASKTGFQFRQWPSPRPEQPVGFRVALRREDEDVEPDWLSASWSLYHTLFAILPSQARLFGAKRRNDPAGRSAEPARRNLSSLGNGPLFSTGGRGAKAGG